MKKASVLIENCRVLLGSPGRGDKFRSILLQEGRIKRLSDSPTQSVEGEVVRVDAHDCTVLPGLIDTHCHLFQQGSARRTLDLRGATSITSIRLRLFSRSDRVTKGEWIVGGGWDQETLSDARFPTRRDIDDLTPQNPTLLTRVCGHVGLLNTKAIESLDLEMSADGHDQLLERDEQGNLTGIIREDALTAVQSKIPRQSAMTTQEDLLTAEYEAMKNGLTTVHCMLSDNYENELQALKSLHEEGRLSLRYRLYLPAASVEPMERGELEELPRTEMLKAGGVKLFADGSLGARTAALSEPYADEPGQRGILRYTDEQLQSTIFRISSRDFQPAVHAIGDAAVSQTLDAFDQVEPDRRCRIEHASLTTRDLRRRMKERGVCVAVQPHFLLSDVWAGNRLGKERLNDLYSFKSLLNEELNVSGSSDAPVEPLNPLLGIWAAMVRSGYGEDEKLSLDEAVELYTSNAAYASFDEGLVGRIREGFAADLSMLDSDIEGMHPAMIRRVSVAATIVNGSLVYSYEGIS